MRYLHFDIRNFKGIEHVRLDLSKSPQSRVHTLIGLNESGKTTILEAIDRWSYREALDVLSVPGYAQHEVHELIPIAKRANFNDSISISASVALDQADQKEIAKILRVDHGITLSAPIYLSEITQTYRFTASRVQPSQPSLTWTVSAKGKRAANTRASRLAGTDLQAVMNVTKSYIPRIVYFPNFLFEFPDKIYLEAPPADDKKHAFYRTVLQDVLDAIGDKTNLGEHILARAKSTEAFDKKSLASVLLKMGGHITKTVFSNWDKIFKRPAGKKEIVVFIDKDERSAYFLQLRLKEGNDYYEISERSLGFRWFFTYLLLTQYRGFRKEGPRKVVFLLDEPASNLHPSAQTQLLDSFQSLPDECRLIYTTHSHHLIKPEWLDGAFVVRNAGLDYGKDEDAYTSRRTLITLQRYREFAAQHPNQTTYFQPVLDVLDYVPSRLELVPDVVMIEGKNDFYTLRYMSGRIAGSQDLHLLPGSGAGSLDALIRLYVGWGRNFIILLDSDDEGETQRERYSKLFGSLVAGRVFTLGDLNPAWNKRGMERMFSSAEQLAIQHAAYPEASGFNKTHFARALQELILTKRVIPLDASTEVDFSTLLNALEGKLIAAKSSAAASGT